MGSWSQWFPWSVLGGDEAAQKALEGLKRAVGFIRKELAGRVNLRNTPQIKFILDQSIEYGVHMSRLIDDVTVGIKEREDQEEESAAWWDEPEQ